MLGEKNEVVEIERGNKWCRSKGRVKWYKSCVVGVVQSNGLGYGGVGPFGDMVGWCPLPRKC